MSYSFQPGDLVTGTPLKDGVGDNFTQIPARHKGADYWTLRLSRSSIMIVIETPTVLPWSQRSYVTVLHDGQLVEVILADVQRMDGETQ